MKFIILILSFFTLFACSNVEQKEIRSDATITTKGMSCPMCANNIDRVLKKLPGVEDTHINLSKGVVTVQFKPGLKPSLADLKKAVEDAGFSANNAKYSQ